ncbi:hypothetical protein [Streptomyces sp. UG1]|uniref:hypothetical protein n=1 Tax=Streptomyces sp. UG1 TaxID=3417652 RepID=UPI003CF39A1C
MPGQGRRSRSDAAETEVLRGGGRGGGRASSDADETAVLPAVGGTAGIRRPGDGAAGIPRPAPAARADGWSAFERPSARRSDVPSPVPGETRRTPAVRDPWSEPEEPEEPRAFAEPGPAAASGTTHDPHEVTVQLDAVDLQRDNLLHAAKDGPGGGDGSDGPVFVDESGRRSRRFRRIGMAVGLACAVYAVVILATVLSGNSDAPWLPVEGPREKPAGKVDTSPQPAESAPQPSATGSASPDTSPTASTGTGTVPSPGATASAPGASPTAGSPGTSADPKPSSTKPAADPRTDPAQDPDPPTQSTTGAPDPSPTGGGATEEPTDPATTEEPAVGPVANGPSDPIPFAQEPDPAASSSAAPSPEYIL